MKTVLLILLFAAMQFAAFSQTGAESVTDGKSVSDSVALGEVIVRAGRVTDKDGSMRLFPTKEQKAASTNGYGLLSRLSLPYITVDEIAKTVTVPPTFGNLQIRINGVVATARDIMSLDLANVRYVDYVRNPDPRYGKDITLLINIVSDRAQTGYTVGMEAMQTATAMRHNDEVFARFSKGIHEFGVAYSFACNRTENTRYEETAGYLMPDNTVTTVKRTDDDCHRKTFYHDMQLQYSAVDSARYALKITLGGALSRMPEYERRRVTAGGGIDGTARISSADNTSSAILDAYLKYDLTEKQSLTANITGNYAASDYSYAYAGKTPYAYTSSGSNGTVAGELVYSNMLRPFALSGGVKLYAEYSGVDYAGHTIASNSVRNTDIYVFAQIDGRRSNLSYMLGAGVSRYGYSQGHEQYGYWLFRPQARLSYAPLGWLRLSYDVEMRQHPPRLEYLGRVAVRNNEFEMTAGNPALRVNKELEQSLTMSLQYPSFYAQVMTVYRMMPRCSMSRIDRVTDDDGSIVFISSRTNQRRINMFYVNGYANYGIMQGKLSFTAMAGVYRFFNYGDDYTHFDTAFNWSFGTQAYLGRLSLAANVNNGWNFTEGESRSRSPIMTSLTASYKFGDFTLSAFWQYCFQDEVRMFQTEQLNRYVSKMQRMYSGDMGNMVSVRLSWRLSHGRRRDGIRHSVRKKDSSSGIIRN